MHKIVIRRSFSDITESCIEACRHAEETLINVCHEDENISFLVDLFFTDYEKNSKEYFMKKELENIVNRTISNNIDYYRNHKWMTRIYSGISNPLVDVLDFITNNIHCSLNQKFFNETGMLWAFQFHYDYITPIFHDCFSSEEEMKSLDFTNNASDIIKFLENYADDKMKSL